MADLSMLVSKIGQDFGGRLKQSEDGQALYVIKDDIVQICKVLKDSFGFAMLADITAAEYEDVLEVVYHLMVLDDAQPLRIKVTTAKDNPSVPSIITVWKAANVMEREIFDLMGINFEGHNDLKRILCPDDFVGHPLRKDFKLNITERFR